MCIKKYYKSNFSYYIYIIKIINYNDTINIITKNNFY